MKANKCLSIALTMLLFLSSTSSLVMAQNPKSSSSRTHHTEVPTTVDLSSFLAWAGKNGPKGFSLMPEYSDVSMGEPSSIIHPAPAVNLPMAGNGTLGRITKWTGFTNSNSVAGDSTIYEDKFGLVGIGTDSPTSKLTVAGVIQSSAGFKFPDGTLQTTAFLPDQVVRSINGLKGEVTLAPGANITVSQAGNVLTIAAPAALTRVIHNNSLIGDGTAASPLSVVANESLIQPFTGVNNIEFDPGEKQLFNGFDLVPAGKRLVVEHVSVSCDLPLGQRLLGIEVGDGGPGALNIFQNVVPIYLGDFPDIIGFNKSHFAASQPMRLYIEQGRALKIQVTRSSNAGEAGCGIAGSGFLVDVP